MKFQRFLFWLLIFLLPVQLGRHFWPEWSYVFGLKIDYLSPTIYLTDILVLVILGLWVLKKAPQQQNLKKMNPPPARRIGISFGNPTFSFAGGRLRTSAFLLRLRRSCASWSKFRPIRLDAVAIIFPLAVFGFLLLSCFLAQNQGAAFYKFFKLIEFAFLGIYVSKEKIKLAEISLPLSLAVVYSFLIAFFQFLKQETLGGVFHWLGERSFSVSTPGIAKTVFQGRLLLRPYATISHPNVLAGFVLISLILIFVSKPTRNFKKILKWSTFVLGVVTIAFSFSRSTWAGGLLAILLFVFLASFAKKKKILALLGVFCLVLVFSQNILRGESFFQRIEFNKIALQMVKTRPLIGVGLNNFIPQLPDYWPKFGFTYWLQPVHNIFLLTAAEIGLVGLLIFLWFLFLTFKKLVAVKNRPLIIALSTILFLGFFDHYWLTLQQTQLLLTVILGLGWVKTRV